ncbi:MAG TPA: hypothetical protein VK912_09800 [Longimicrobiales bacterium]|nr:hypothetical protein [Longimicrobiales bacterium]
MTLDYLPRITAACRLAACAALLSACAVPPQAECFEAARIGNLPATLDEASGIAISRRDPGIIWAHNDSEGIATLYALDRDGALIAGIEIPAAGTQSDWEDIAAGPCPAGDCLYIADIGDNLHDRQDRAILRIAEPDVHDAGTIAIETYPIRYPDGPVDAEALFVMPDTSVYIITKGRRQDISLFRYPPPLRPGERVVLEHVQQLHAGVAQMPDLVTAADASRDGNRIAVRTYTRVALFRFDGDTLARLSGAGGDITSLGEPQGEGLAIAGGDTLLLATEAGPAQTQPFLSRVVCRAR